MNRQTIAVDVDDVLAASAEGFVAYSNQQWGTRLKSEDYDEHWARMWQVERDEAAQRAHTLYRSGVFRTMRHFEAAKPVLLKLAERYKLVITTSRPRHVQEHTLAWIDEYYQGIFEEIHFAGFYDELREDSHKLTKAEMLQSIGADYLIDDHPKHCLAAAKAGITALLFGEYSWSKDIGDHQGVIRVKDWLAVEKFFDGLDTSANSLDPTRVDSSFRERVYVVVAQIPRGRVMTYGQIAALCGNARAARIVGGIAHFGNPDLPWQRVVNKSGGLAAGYPGGKSGHKQVLEAEGITVSDDYRVDVSRLLWHPKEK